MLKYNSMLLVIVKYYSDTCGGTISIMNPGVTLLNCWTSSAAVHRVMHAYGCCCCCCSSQVNRWMACGCFTSSTGANTDGGAKSVSSDNETNTADIYLCLTEASIDGAASRTQNLHLQFPEKRHQSCL